MKSCVPLLASLLAAAAALACPPNARAQDGELAARHILVAYRGAERSQATRTKEEAKALAEKVLAEVRAPGADFTKVSHTYSDDKVSDGQGGFLGIFKPGTMTPAFQKAVEGLKDGEISGVVETPFGFHVIERLSLADARAILEAGNATIVAAVFAYKGAKNSTAVRAKDLAREDAAKAVEFLRKGGTFETIPPELGAAPMLKPMWMAAALRKGAIRPEFRAVEDAAFATPVGQFSDPFDTLAGWVVLRRVPWFRLHLQHLLVMHAGSERVPDGIRRTKDEARARAQEALKKLDADPAAWKKLVAEYSDEPGAGERSGDLGVVEPGMMVPEFDVFVAPLTPGGHTAVVETRFGYHVVRRVD